MSPTAGDACNSDTKLVNDENQEYNAAPTVTPSAQCTHCRGAAQSVHTI